MSLQRDALDTVMTWQRAAGSLEVCALCAVDRFGEQHLLRLTNHAGVIGSFEVSRVEEQIARSVAAEKGWKIVAFVHSHPHHAPDMSSRDTRTFERDTLPWIIIATTASYPAQRTFIRDIARISDGLAIDCSSTGQDDVDKPFLKPAAGE